jgi:2-aminoethylphosphonate-pyruvate transaminase
MLLLNPGPVTLTERVRSSMLQSDLCHRESEFFDLQDEARRRLLATYQLDPKEWTAVLMTASGTGAVESMISCMVPDQGRLLIVENGVYGERISQICERYQISHERLIGSWMEAPDTGAIAARLDAASPLGAFTHVAIVHHETTTGRLNDLQAVSELCRNRGVMLLVDGVSSFGAEAIDFGDPSLAAVAATANKCLHGVPGVAFVIARRASLSTATARSYYLDLARLAKLQDQRSTPFTPAVHAHYALVEALREFEEEGGRAARYARYLALAEQVRHGLLELGIESILPAGQSSVVLRAYRLPAGVDYATLHDTMKQHGFVIYAGQGDLSKTLFRISTMGHVTSNDMTRLIDCFSPWAVRQNQPAHSI